MVSLFTGDQKDYWLTSLRLQTFIQVAIWKPRFQMSVTWISRSTWEMILGFISDPLTKSVRQKYRCPKKKRWCLRKKKERGRNKDVPWPVHTLALTFCFTAGATVTRPASVHQPAFFSLLSLGLHWGLIYSFLLGILRHRGNGLNVFHLCLGFPQLCPKMSQIILCSL